MLYLLKGRTRCKGNLCPQEDMYESYLKCLQIRRTTLEAVRALAVSKTVEEPSQKRVA